MKRMGIFYLGVFLGVVFLAPIIIPTTAVTEKVDATVINIGVIAGNKYNVTSIELAKNTAYTIVLWNERTDEYHNMIIATSGRTVTEDTATKQADETRIGPDPNNLGAEDAGGPDKSWNGTYTTPNEDKYIWFFCEFSGHFAAGMWGYFKVGEPTGSPPGASSTPGFEIVLGLVIFAGFAILRIRKR